MEETLNQKVWWGIAFANRTVAGPLGTGWLVNQPEPRWNTGIMHWPAGFTTRRQAREEVRALTLKYLAQGWRFKPIKITMTYRVEPA